MATLAYDAQKDEGIIEPPEDTSLYQGLVSIFNPPPSPRSMRSAARDAPHSGGMGRWRRAWATWKRLWAQVLAIVLVHSLPWSVSG